MIVSNGDTPENPEPAPGGAPGPGAADVIPPGRRARRLLRCADRAALATARRNDDGWPYPSLTLTALDHDASPLLLISRLADHTRNILRDDRVGLLFDGTAGLADPLSGARVSVLGRARQSDDPRHRRRFLARHPASAGYAVFADFAIYRVEIECAHLVAGFGRARWLPAAEIRFEAGRGAAAASALADDEADLVAAFNRDYENAASLFAQELLGAAEGDWALTGFDPEGCDLRCRDRVLRLDFDTPAGDVDMAQAALIRLLQQAYRLREERSPINGNR